MLIVVMLPQVYSTRSRPVYDGLLLRTMSWKVFDVYAMFTISIFIESHIWIF